MTASHPTTSTDGSESCKTMDGGQGRAAGGKQFQVFSELPLGSLFLDLAYGSWWVKTAPHSAACDDHDDAAFAFQEVAGFGKDEQVMEGGNR